MTGSVTEERFWAKVEKTEDCWLWTGAKTRGDYGSFKSGGKVVKPHRYSFELLNGPIPPGLCVDHICHVRLCVRPEHLRLATNKQNAENLSGLRRDNKSGIRGVFWNKANQKWVAQVTHNGEMFYLGLFSDIREAEAAAINKRNELFTHNDADRA